MFKLVRKWLHKPKHAKGAIFSKPVDDEFSEALKATTNEHAIINEFVKKTLDDA